MKQKDMVIMNEDFNFADSEHIQKMFIYTKNSVNIPDIQKLRMRLNYNYQLF